MQITKYVLGISLGFCVAAAAQNASPLGRSLSLADSIRIALEHNLDIKIEQFGPEISRYNLNLAYAGWEPVADFSGTHSYSKQPGGIDAQNRPYGGTTTDRDTYSTGLAGVLPTGLTYDLSGDLSNTSGENLVGPFENSSGSLGIRLRQPLLKNFWIDSTRLSIKVSKTRLKVSEEGLRFQIMNTVNSVEQVYYDLILARESVKVQEKALQLAEQLLAENKKRVEVGAMAPLDEKQAESQVAARRADVLSAQQSLSTQQNILKSLLSDNYALWQETIIEPTDVLTAVPQVFSLQDSWQRGLTMRPDLIQAKLELERLGYVLKYQRNQRYPQLDAIGSYGRTGSQADFTGAFRDITDDNGPFWSFGGIITFPLGNTAARNNYRISKAEQQQALLRLKKLEQLIMVAIDDSLQQTRTSYDRIGATRAYREYAEAALAAEQKKLENGKSTNFEVLSLQRDLTAARLSEAQAMADYHKALATLALREGSTLERNNVRVEVK